MLNNSPEREDRLPPFFFAFFPPVSLSSSFGRKEEKEKVEKKSAAKSLKRILSRARERCRDYMRRRGPFVLRQKLSLTVINTRFFFGS